MNLNSGRDHGLRQVINAIQEQLVDQSQPLSLLNKLLKQLMQLCECPYGYVLSIHYTEDKPSLQLIVSAFFQGDPKKFYTNNDQLLNENIDPLFARCLETQQYLTTSETSELIICENIPSKCPPIHNIALHPVIENKCVTSIFVAINSKHTSDFHNEFIGKTLPPLWRSFAIALRLNINKGLINPGTSPFHNKHLINLTNACFNGVLTVNSKMEISSFNYACAHIFQIIAHEALGKSLQDFILDKTVIDEIINSKEDHKHIARHSKKFPLVEGKRTSGERFMMRLSIFKTQYFRETYTTIVLDDLSEKLGFRQESKENLQRFQMLTTLAPVGIIQIDESWNCSYFNDQWSRLSGLTHDESLFRGWIDAIHYQDAELVLQELHQCLSNGKDFDKEFRLQTPVGIVTWVHATARALFNEHSIQQGFLCVITDITHHRNNEARLKQFADYDPLTGLINRKFFLDRLQTALNGSIRRGDIAVFYIDLDGFKTINDTLGHDAGDQLLKTIAKRLTDTVREEDSVARLGGDEFCVIITHLLDPHAASQVAEKIIKSVQAPIPLREDHEICITCSIGITVGNARNHDANSILKQSDIALYRAKKMGRNNYQYFTDELDALARARKQLRDNLHSALDQQQLNLHYQPQIHIDSGHLVGFEVLMRWMHPKLGKVEPEEFIPLMEETGLIENIGMWAIEKATQQYMQWRLENNLSDEITLSINISARQLKDPHFYDALMVALQKSGMPANRLILEIKESIIIETQKFRSLIMDLKRLGVQVSLDDFGRKLSSLSDLVHLQPNQIKIDRKCLDTLYSLPDSISIIKASVAIAKSLNIAIYATGVDSKEKLKFLKSIKCNICQGYYFSEALSTDDVRAWLKN